MYYQKNPSALSCFIYFVFFIFSYILVNTAYLMCFTPISIWPCSPGVPPPDITWQKDGQAVSSTGHPEIRIANVNGKVSMVINNPKITHSGKYTCTARNSVGFATSSAQLVVRGKVTCFKLQITLVQMAQSVEHSYCGFIRSLNPKKWMDGLI